MHKKDIISILDAEIAWCVNDKDHRIMPDDWHEGFIQGLRQAKHLIKAHTESK